MSEEEKELTEEEQAKLKDLTVRRLVALHAVRTLAAEKEDPRAREAEQKYRQQLANLDAKIEEITGRPPDIVVQLQPGVLFGEAHKLS